jgi:hypothetical protein
MTIALAIIGGIVVIIGAASRVPPAAAAFLRACIPLIKAFHELRGALRPGPRRNQNTVKGRPRYSEEEPMRNSAPLE